MRKNTSKFLLRRVVLVTVCILLVALIEGFLTFLFGGISLSYRSLFFEMGIILGVLILVYYSIMLVTYFRVRNAPKFSIVIDEQGIHANKIFVPWDNIAAIYPVRVGRVEYVGVFPRSFELMLRNSKLHPFIRFSYRWVVALARSRGISPISLRPDDMSTQELLQQLWSNYFPEYQRYQISTSRLAH